MNNDCFCDNCMNTRRLTRTSGIEEIIDAVKDIVLDILDKQGCENKEGN